MAAALRGVTHARDRAVRVGRTAPRLLFVDPVTVICDGVDDLVIDARSGRLVREEKGVGNQLTRAILG
jgi:hypothetical protein